MDSLQYNSFQLQYSKITFLRGNVFFYIKKQGKNDALSRSGVSIKKSQSRF